MAFRKKHTDEEEPIEELGDNFVPVIPVDEAVHTNENPFCNDMSCPCHEDKDAINDLNNAYQDGLVSSADADRIYRGKTI